MGFKPHTDLPLANKTQNFMFNMREQGLIDHSVIALKTDRTNNWKNQHVKFGGWDRVSIKEGTQLELFRTLSPSSWALEAGKVSLNNDLLS
mmetsp:Transcript_11191/g.18816  ORF Transcript_11191/g.18816 Transcript_11191/m.18816 type:complete len:91 (-) Transcript_11191:1049-1321(-)